MIDPDRLSAAYEIARTDLLAQRSEKGYWVGELSASALSTATAISTLAIAARAPSVTAPSGDSTNDRGLIDGGIRWILEQQNPDGGWGDTDKSHSNIATTMLAVAAIHLAGRAESLAETSLAETSLAETLSRASTYIESRGGMAGLRRRYGKDKTFAVPILTNYALAGLVDWSEVAPLPFELACVPQRFYRWTRMPVVSYAIPALVAIGQARFFYRPPRFPLTLLMRRAAIDRSLRVLERMQPQSGGYLEAVPLTSFVTMSLAGTGRVAHRVARQGLTFLRESVRPDGSWPIDTNLATWLTSLSINALAAAEPDIAAYADLSWLLGCQHVQPHPFTGAAPGGWGWTDLSGAVPDADDTAAALLALRQWSRSPSCGAETRAGLETAAASAVTWLLDLQNRNGGWPTFCRGWGKLPFDRSGADLTAHALRALHGWRGIRPAPIDRALQRGWRYLQQHQRADGSWVPLWFGHQDHPLEENPVFGTARVLMAYGDLRRGETDAAQRGYTWLASVQQADGGWSGGVGPGGEAGSRLTSSVEETALAVEALLGVGPGASTPLLTSLSQGLQWLVDAVLANRHRENAPIGFYFAKLWYYERLYPLVFVVAALGRAVRRLGVRARQLQQGSADNAPQTEQPREG